MKVRIKKSKLTSLLGKTQNIAEKKATMPLLINVLLKAENNHLKIFATDLEVSLTDTKETEIIKEGEVAVNTKQLFEIVKELDEGDIILEVIERDENLPNRLHIEQGKSVFNIVYVNSSEYPVFPTLKNQKFLKIDKEIFMEMIDRTIYSVSNDETRYHLNGVFFEGKRIDNKDCLRMVSTDSHRLSLVDRFIDLGDLKLGVIVPRKGLIEIRKIIDLSDDPVFISIEGSQFILKTGDTLLMIRLIEGKYPDYIRFVPKDIVEGKEKSFIINRGVFLNLVRRVSLLSDQTSKEVTFKFSKGKMKITSNDPKIGDAREELEIQYSGDDFEIGFNAKYVIDVLNSFFEDKFKLCLKDSEFPGVIKPEKDKDYTCVIMPIRL